MKGSSKLRDPRAEGKCAAAQTRPYWVLPCQVPAVTDSPGPALYPQADAICFKGLVMNGGSCPESPPVGAWGVRNMFAAAALFLDLGKTDVLGVI